MTFSLSDGANPHTRIAGTNPKDGRPTYFVTFFLFHRVGMLFLLFQFIEEKVTYFGIQMMTGVATSYMVVFIGIYLSIELYSCFD